MIIYLSLGANLGNRKAAIKKALAAIEDIEGTHTEAVSAFYETAPWGKTDQPAFFNIAAKISTNLTPSEFLRKTQQIEKDLGRVRHEHWGARTIDIDLLFSPEYRSDTEELHLPHLYMKERAFVLVPLAEIAPDEKLDGKSIKEWLSLCPDNGTVTAI